ncbi:MAG TPA: glutaminase [Solirubrobacteraceae bacterium]|nr:glutaminase [Solirubrobacteraceae bacterium]
MADHTRERTATPFVSTGALPPPETVQARSVAGDCYSAGDAEHEFAIMSGSKTIATVSPGKGALGTFAPRLDAAGNSVKGQLVARHLSEQLGLDLLISRPAGGYRLGPKLRRG